MIEWRSSMRSARHPWLIVAAFGLAIAGFTPDAAHAQAPQVVAGAQTLDSDGVIALIGKTPDLVIVDARHEKDYQEGHIEGAVRLLDDDMIQAGPASLGQLAAAKTTPLLFYCNGPACGRAAKSASAALAWGYGSVSYYYAGIPDWRARNLPLVK
jgi:rhodanese-related sulfurtransferase